MKKIYFALFLIISLGRVNGSYSQCTPITINGNYTQSTSDFLSGTYIVSGTFHIPAGITVFVQPYSIGNCGKLEVHANTIIIDGNIIGDYAGFTGGSGGQGGSTVTSLTGDAIAIDNCSNSDYTGRVTVEEGKAGLPGSGQGGGGCGGNGQSGSGPKQQCLNTYDDAGMIGSAGGGGGGGGGSYGGNGTNGGSGGNGTNVYSVTGISVSSGFTVLAGNGGTGGLKGTPYGTAAGTDIDLGSGGAGAGGGGRAFDLGLVGNNGGSGGGMVKLFATDTLIVSGFISVNGKNGLLGGGAGNGGQSPKCCSDNCDDCGETTLSCGAGGGGGSGGGSGGGIYLETLNYTNISGALISKGGSGGGSGIKGLGASCVYTGGTFCGSDQSIVSGSGSDGNVGGAGSGGRIKIVAPNCQNSVITPISDVSGGTGAQAGTYQLICNTTSIDELAYHTYDLEIFPNPGQNQINISFKNQLVANTVSDFQIIDVSGRQVMQEVCKLNHDMEQTLFISQLAKGIYFIHLRVDGTETFQKFIKN